MPARLRVGRPGGRGERKIGRNSRQHCDQWNRWQGMAGAPVGSAGPQNQEETDQGGKQHCQRQSPIMWNFISRKKNAAKQREKHQTNRQFDRQHTRKEVPGRLSVIHPPKR